MRFLERKVVATRTINSLSFSFVEGEGEDAENQVSYYYKFEPVFLAWI
jgi:hypothetical protein